MKTRQIMVNSRGRSEDGCILTFENEDGKTLTIHRKGPTTQGVREACAIALRYDESFRVVSYCTPQTVFADLDGARATEPDGAYGRPQESPFPEAMMLGRAGLLPLLHPRLRRSSGGKR